jgi:DNA replication ATP-dependent helicase Dna2
VTGDLWARLERLLHRERAAARTDHRDLMALPVEDRVERGESMSGLGWLGEEGGVIRLACAENLSKYRPGDALVLRNEEDDRGRGDDGAGLAVTYGSYDDRSGVLRVERDRWRNHGRFEPGGRLQLDPVSVTLTDLSLDALERLRRGDTRPAAAARGLLEHRTEIVEDASARAEAARLLRQGIPLDAAQAEAFSAALSRRPLAMVQGPPGTGKTWLLAHAVAALARRGERILVTAFTHRAVNHALRKVAQVAPDLRVIKAGRATAADDLRGTPVQRASSLRRVAPDPGRPTVVGATVFGTRSAWDTDPFDRVVVDEAAQVPLSVAACALLAAEKTLLVGDHRQMGPIVRGSPDDPLAAVSLFEHLAPRYPPVLLRTTYRMNRDILEFPGAAFYGGRLEPSPEAAARRFEPVPGGPYGAILGGEPGAVLALVDHEGFRSRSEPEARVVSGIVVDLMARQGVAADRIAVVAPYRAQLRLIRTLTREGLRDAGYGGRVLPVIDTVERIQGQERDVVIVSLTASDPDTLAGEHAEFFFSPNRLNVTLTRARTKLVVVASEHVFRSWPRDWASLRSAEWFRRLRATLPAFPVTAGTRPLR